MTIFHAVVGPIAGALLTAVAAWIVGSRITAQWGIWQKRREATLSATAEFSRLYGQFFSNWKLWNLSLDCKDAEIDRRTLIKKVHSAEAGVEALLVLLAVQSSLSKEDIEVAGKFRQAYQQLREIIKKTYKEGKEKKLNWPVHDAPGYAAFKRLAASFTLLLSSMDLKETPSALEASNNLAEITHNRWETCWQVHCSSCERLCDWRSRRDTMEKAVAV